jgi:hypothetical protein
MEPNIFKYATSELSQDAFFCWLLEWSKKDYSNREINKISLNFINTILKERGFSEIQTVDKICIEQQVPTKSNMRMDFYAEINDENIIVFEDKISTTEHDNQLTEYKTYMKETFPNKNIAYVYLKSDLVFISEKERIKESDWLVFDLFKLTELLGKKDVGEIYNQYVQWLHSKKEKYSVFTAKKINDWKYEDWIGFGYHLNSKGFWKFYKGEDTFSLILSDRYDEGCYISLELGGVYKMTCVMNVNFESDNINKREYCERMRHDAEAIFNPSSNLYECTLTDNSNPGKKATIATIDALVFSDDGTINLEKTKVRIDDIIAGFDEFYDDAGIK